MLAQVLLVGGCLVTGDCPFLAVPGLFLAVPGLFLATCDMQANMRC
jgi:hypothetical protein